MRLSRAECKQYRNLLVEHVVKPCQRMRVEGLCGFCVKANECPNRATMMALDKALDKKHGPTPARDTE